MELHVIMKAFPIGDIWERPERHEGTNTVDIWGRKSLHRTTGKEQAGAWLVDWWDGLEASGLEPKWERETREGRSESQLRAGLYMAFWKAFASWERWVAFERWLWRLWRNWRGWSRIEERRPLRKLLIKVRVRRYFEIALAGFVVWLAVRCERKFKDDS